jgi:hypothetical protein
MFSAWEDDPKKDSVSPSTEEIKVLAARSDRIETLRQRLANVSWFNAQLNEHLARRANKEDGVKGRFWEGRFKCRRLLGEEAILAAMAYVDLQLVRANQADSPESSPFTSGFERIHAYQARKNLDALNTLLEVAPPSSQTASEPPSAPETTLPSPPPAAAGSLAGSGPVQVGGLKELAPDQREEVLAAMAKVKAADWLCPIDSRIQEKNAKKGILPITLEEYLESLDLWGRILREGKPGAIPDHKDSIMNRLGLNTRRWLEAVLNYGCWFWRVVGRVAAMAGVARKAVRRWFKGIARARYAFGP